MHAELSPNLRPRDTVTFGTFASSPLTWRVLDVRKPAAAPAGDIAAPLAPACALLITEQVIDALKFDVRYTGTTWEGCTLRAWLNADFAAHAFTPAEQRRILQTAVPNPFNAPYGTDGGEDTRDYLFCLSLTEARRYFSTDDDRKAPPSPYAEQRGVATYRGGAAWWLRSPGDDVCVAATIEPSGYVNEGGWFMYTDTIGVRPAMWVSLA